MSYTSLKIHDHHDKLESLGKREEDTSDREFLRAPIIGTYGISTHTDGIEYRSREYIRLSLGYDTGAKISI
ncbi:hypothetical protein [Stenotrophomonas phage RAS14]